MSFFFQVFEDKPDLPPSPAQAAQKCSESTSNFMRSIQRLLTNKGYVLLLLSYGINVGVFYALSTLLNQVLLRHFPVSELFHFNVYDFRLIPEFIHFKR